MKRIILLALVVVLCACAVDPGYMPDGVAFRPGCDALITQSDDSAIRLECVPGFVPRPCTTTVTEYGFADPRKLTVRNCF